MIEIDFLSHTRMYILQMYEYFRFPTYIKLIFFRRNRGLIYCMLGLMMLIVAIGVTAGTAVQSSDKPALYVLYIGKAR